MPTPLLLAALLIQPPAPPQESRPLFNGRDLSGWVDIYNSPGTWTVKDGELVCSGHPNGLLRTDKPYQNFVLDLDWKHLDPKGNSGLFIRSDPLPTRGQPFTRAVEVQVMLGGEGEGFTSDGDIFPINGARMTPENPRPKGGSRAFPTEKRTKPAGEWNHYTVEVNGPDVSLAVNGKVVTQGHGLWPTSGYICLESEGSEIHFKNLRIRELPATVPATPTDDASPVRVESDPGFRPLFNGKDFAGWKFTDAHKDHWTTEDWTIKFDGQGEDLWTEQPYKDFVLIADWRWTGKPEEHDLPVILANGEQDQTDDGKPMTRKTPEAGDSGIYLRGNSKSQVNIWCWPIGSGEVYGYRTDKAMTADVRAGVTPRVNADKPIGEWNRFVITMKGDRLTVVLNGKTVLDEARLPGVPETGPIALQKHGGAIQFGNLFIKELKD
jgi:hypothetical protein